MLAGVELSQRGPSLSPGPGGHVLGLGWGHILLGSLQQTLTLSRNQRPSSAGACCGGPRVGRQCTRKEPPALWRRLAVAMHPRKRWSEPRPTAFGGGDIPAMQLSVAGCQAPALLVQVQVRLLCWPPHCCAHSSQCVVGPAGWRAAAGCCLSLLEGGVSSPADLGTPMSMGLQHGSMLSSWLGSCRVTPSWCPSHISLACACTSLAVLTVSTGLQLCTNTEMSSEEQHRETFQCCYCTYLWEAWVFDPSSLANA